MLGVTLPAYGQRRLGRQFLCDIAMAHGALDIILAVRPGFPFGINGLMAAGAVFSGWNRLMRLDFRDRRDGGGQSEQNEQDKAEQRFAESDHGQIS
jgi:hypothetical protein